jgi:hypothetical protein
MNIAEQVAFECKVAMDDAKISDERYWILATEGDMALIRGTGNADNFYLNAIDELPAGNDGMVQSTYDQICRLYKVFENNGYDRMKPTLEVFRTTAKFNLRPGPLGDCDGLLKR